MKEVNTALWYTRLRIFSFFGQLLILAASVSVFELTLPWKSILFILFLIPLSNLLARAPFRKSCTETQFLGSLLLLDTILLTAVLYLAGGPTNPFTIVYLLHVVLAAIILNQAWTWIVAGLSFCGFASLFLYSIPVPEWHDHGMNHGFSLHLHGMLFAFLLVSLLATYFLNKIVGDLQKKERMIERFQNNAINQQRLVSLATITAGAAHELGTPLATIAVIAHELERAFERRKFDNELLEDIGLLKAETDRCKKVLAQLSESTGDLLGEALQEVKLSELLRDAVEPLKFDSAFTVSSEADFTMPKIPKRSLTLALRVLIKNAFEASEENNLPVEVKVKKEQSTIELEVIDQGIGMEQDVLERVGEPFYSKKIQTQGMGLGVYLSKLTVKQLGGDLTFTSKSGRGTSAKLSFPIDCSSISEAA